MFFWSQLVSTLKLFCHSSKKNWNLAFVNFSSQVIREHTWHIFDKTTTCDVGNPIDQFFFDEWQSCFDIDTSWFKKNVFKFFAFKFWKNFFTRASCLCGLYR